MSSPCGARWLWRRDVNPGGTTGALGSGMHPPRIFASIQQTLAMRHLRLTAVIESEGDGYVALCPELDIASQGKNVEDARENLCEAVELFFETADSSEAEARLQSDVFVTSLEVAVG